MDLAFAMRVFVQVVEEGSFSRAGPRVGISQSSASRYISVLENELGVQLIQRSTRKLNLTEEGKIYFERARHIIADIDEARDAIKNMNATPSGLLRVTAPATFGRHHIAPLLGEFHKQYPSIKICLSLSDKIVDIIGGGFDLAIRFAWLADSNFVAKQIAASHSIICAHPDYIKEAGIPKIPADLKTHNCLTFRDTPGQNTWSFERAEENYSVAVSGSLFADNADALLSAGLSGLGVIHLPKWMVAPETKAGNLVQLLETFDLLPRTTPIHAIFPHKQHLASKIRVFMDFLKDQYKGRDW